MKPLHIAIIVAAVLPLAYFVAPTETKVGLKESIARMTNDPGQICLDYARSDLKDPTSAKLFSTIPVIDKTINACSINDEWKCYKIKYHAKNSYGAYVEASKVCAISNADHKVSEGHTESYERIKAMDAKIKRTELETAAIHLEIQLRISSKEAVACINSMAEGDEDITPEKAKELCETHFDPLKYPK